MPTVLVIAGFVGAIAIAILFLSTAGFIPHEEIEIEIPGNLTIIESQTINGIEHITLLDKSTGDYYLATKNPRLNKYDTFVKMRDGEKI